MINKFDLQTIIPLFGSTLLQLLDCDYIELSLVKPMPNRNAMLVKLISQNFNIVNSIDRVWLSYICDLMTDRSKISKWLFIAARILTKAPP